MSRLGVVFLGTGRAATSIAVGSRHSCALLDDSSVKCWGCNAFGQLGVDSSTNAGGGDGTTMMVDAQTAKNITDAVSISCGEYHTCVVIAGSPGAVKCWGKGGAQLGQDSEDSIGGNSRPMPPDDIHLGETHVIAVSAGYDHTCALMDGGNVKCWGGAYGALKPWKLGGHD